MHVVVPSADVDDSVPVNVFGTVPVVKSAASVTGDLPVCVALPVQ